MRVSNTTIASAGAAAAGAFLLRHELKGRQAAERMAAAALESLLRAIDANDPDTGAHVRRVAAYALVLADAAALDDHDKRTVERVALFHDVGKIHEALFDIIHDHHKLTPAERRAIVTHPARGAQVLEPLSGFYPDLPAGVLSHHERWDGRGYPRGLKGKRIPLSARIVSIADTFDAITHSRRYRGRRSIEKAREVIQEGRGTQFDPTLVDLFLMPPVFACIHDTYRQVSHWRGPIEPRPPGRDEDQVPDIIFRWRPERIATRAPRQRGRVPKTPR
ncbi:MAG TPA: HD domain-containing phosphohydrolase [Gemmatimonadaceae bacterium]|jgi:HD-GYP domain-containing protein (c-di-GMP phosphodiesterase class II)